MNAKRFPAELRVTAPALALRLKKAGQVTVELLLVLPVFILMLLFIMEIGNLAFQTILAHHCAYELARIGSLVAGPAYPFGPDAGGLARANDKMRNAMAEMISAGEVEGALDPTCPDPQTGKKATDLVVNLKFPVKLLFPGSSTIFEDTPGSRTRTITVGVRMPVEKPYLK